MSKKLSVILIILVILLSVSALAACDETKEFTVTFNGNGGTLISGEEVQTVKEGGSITPPVYEKEGYTLSWDVSFDNITADLTVTANWTVNQYTITFNSTGGGAVAPITRDYGTAVAAPETPIRPGHAFGGWYIDDGTFENLYIFTVMPVGNIELFAKWIPVTEGLSFALINNGAAYAVTGYSGTETAVIIPEIYNNLPVKAIGEYAFEGKDITSIVILQGVISIDEGAFYECAALTAISLPASVISIGEGAFAACTALTSFNIEENSLLASIGNTAFGGCYSLTSITLPDGLGSIGSGAFNGCDALTSVTIPLSVTEIGSNAFYYCDDLTVYSENASKPGGWAENWSGTATAVWRSDGIERNYSFVTEYGSLSPITAYNIQESDVALGQTYYILTGWYDNAQFSGGPVAFPYFSKDGKTTLYAKWEPIQYDITYYLDGGVNNPSNPDAYTIESSEITISDPTKGENIFCRLVS